MISTTRRHLRAALGTGLAGAILLAGCATRTAGTASIGTAGSADTASVGQSSAPATPETIAAPTEEPPSSAAVPATTSEPPGSTAGDGSSVESTNADPGAQVTDASAASTCTDFRTLEASYTHRPAEELLGYQWRWQMYAGKPGLLELWSPDDTTWDFEVPVDQHRDEQLCQQLLGLQSVADQPADDVSRATVTITTQDDRTGTFVLTREDTVGFEDLVLDQLPTDVFEDLNGTLIQWQEQNPSAPASTSGQQPGSTTGQATAPGTTSPGPSTSSSAPEGLEDYANQCEQLVLATVTFTPSGDDKLGVELLFDTEQGSATLQLGESSTSFDFALRDDADPVLLCRMLINDSEERGHDGKDEFGAIGTLHIETRHPDFPTLFEGPFAFPTVNIPTVMGKLMSKESQQEVNKFFEENAG